MEVFETFRLTEQHIRLLGAMYAGFDDGAYDGAPAIGIKRPYGNSDVVGDVAEILGFDDYAEAVQRGEDGTQEFEDATKELMKVHRETGTALQIVLNTQSFKPGLYGRPRQYDTRYWVRME